MTDGATSAPLPVPEGAAPHPLPHLHRVPATALDADPETGELGAPIGTVQMLADAVMGLARAVGGRSVATATFATRDPDVPLTVAARDGEPVVLDIAGRHFALPACVSATPAALTPLSACRSDDRGAMRILVVDDEPAVRDAVDRALRLEGYDVALAADGARGARRARRPRRPTRSCSTC